MEPWTLVASLGVAREAYVGVEVVKGASASDWRFVAVLFVNFLLKCQCLSRDARKHAL